MLLQVLTLGLLAGPVDSAVVRDIEVAPGETLRTTSAGRGEPLVLIAGIFAAAFGFRSIAAPLVVQGYRCIVIEPLGYGWSSHPKQADYSFSAQTERVGEALDSLGITRALFLAQSSGASFAFRPAVARPNLVRGLLSIDGGPPKTRLPPACERRSGSAGSSRSSRWTSRSCATTCAARSCATRATPLGSPTP
jgi:pimeloyl-ACP methyl ester carboxylesterase